MERNRVYSESRYSIFKLDPFKSSESHLKTIKQSLTTRDCSKDYPILVDENFNVIEGRYRLLAWIDLGYPIYFKIAEATTKKDALAIKHIYKSTDAETVCKLFADITQYNDILLLHDMYPEFNCEFIIRVAGCCSWKTWGIHRKRLVSGLMGTVEWFKTTRDLEIISWLSKKYSMSYLGSFEILDSILQDLIFLDKNNWNDVSKEWDEVVAIDEREIKNEILKYHPILKKINDIVKIFNRETNRMNSVEGYAFEKTLDIVKYGGKYAYESVTIKVTNLIGIRLKECI